MREQIEGKIKRGLLNLEEEKKNHRKDKFEVRRTERLLLRLMVFGILGRTFV